jgi:hypothetical protein
MISTKNRRFMKYDNVIEKIRSGSMSRADLVKLKVNANNKYSNGDSEAKYVLDAINNAAPTDSFILFMGVCPGGNFSNRLDIEWKKQEICRFDFPESKPQLDRFNTIYKGDFIVLKKRELIGKTMKLYGHGRVSGIAYDENHLRYLEMNWSN